MGRPPHDLAGGAAIQPWPSSRRSRTRPPRADHAAPSRPGARAGCGAGYPRAGAPGPAAAGAGRDPGGPLRAGAGDLAG
ncbi:MAG TPA: hypothetical protein VK594_09435, partial [Streptosporangiaceae bacterium]|nr:hypothetical protein [Streptosporangiaceae bacterium]